MNISIQELIVIMLCVILFVKPKDLPKLFYKLGKWTQKLRLAHSRMTDELNHIYEADDLFSHKPAHTRPTEISKTIVKSPQNNKDTV